MARAPCATSQQPRSSGGPDTSGIEAARTPQGLRLPAPKRQRRAVWKIGARCAPIGNPSGSKPTLRYHRPREWLTIEASWRTPQAELLHGSTPVRSGQQCAGSQATRRTRHPPPPPPSTDQMGLAVLAPACSASECSMEFNLPREACLGVAQSQRERASKVAMDSFSFLSGS